VTHEDSPLVPSGRTWAITTVSGYTASGYLPDWAQEDPSKTGVAPDRLPIELSDMTHEASFGGQFVRVCPGAEDPGEDSVVLIALMQCSPFVEDDPGARVPLVNVQIFDDIWIMNLDPSGVAEVAEKFHSFAELLVNKVAPELSAARAEWAEHVSVRNP
jgi:hypothetical protein